VKWDPPLPASLGGRVRGPWPRVPKTDEERIQNLPEMLDSECIFYVTEKLDGSSATYVLDRDNFYVCSRNLNLADDPGNSFWQIAHDRGLEAGMRARGGNFAIQGELIGPGIQGNRYKLPRLELRVFAAYELDALSYFEWDALVSIAAALGVETVPRIRRGVRVQEFATRDRLLADADGPSALGGAPREGLVWRAEGTGVKVGFKAISNAFLLATA